MSARKMQGNHWLMWQAAMASADEGPRSVCLVVDFQSRARAPQSVPADPPKTLLPRIRTGEGSPPAPLMRVVCAWCGTEQKPKPCLPRMAGQVSHSICPACFDLYKGNPVKFYRQRMRYYATTFARLVRARADWMLVRSCLLQAIAMRDMAAEEARELAAVKT